jgi:molybdopterin/thiamine biosynthesis adenylyltransferase
MLERDLKYDRLKLIPNWKQERIANAKVAVIGCGALGNEVLKNLALLGIGQIWVVDYDTIEIHNLTRSVLFRESDIGRYKAEVVSERAMEINPDIQVYPILGKLELAMGRGLLREMDVVIGCLDGVSGRRLLNERCYFAEVPWIDGGISHSLGNVALFNPRVPETACYRCKMDTSAWERFNESHSCGYLRDDYRDPKFATTIMTASVIGAYQVEIAIQLILGNSTFTPGAQLSLPVSQFAGFQTMKFSVNEKCPDHRSIQKDISIHSKKFSLDSTPRKVSEELGFDGDWAFDLPFDFVSHFTCEKCGHVEHIAKPQREIKEKKTKCPHCIDIKMQEKIFFQVTNESEVAEWTFKQLYLCDREIIKYKYDDHSISIELFY